jgi:hypothetical protein
MIGWDELRPIRDRELLRTHEEDRSERDGREDVLFRGRRWKRVLSDDLGIDEPAGPAVDQEEQPDQSKHQLKPIVHYLEQRVRRVLERLTTPEELAAHCILWVMEATWDETQLREQERHFLQWQTAGILVEASQVSLERQLYSVERLQGLTPHGILVVQEWNDRIVASVWDNAQPLDQVAIQWGATWAAAGVDCALIGQTHPLYRLPLDSPHLESLVTGMNRAGVAVGRSEPSGRITLGVGLGVHNCDWKTIASRESVRWTPAGVRPLRLIDSTNQSPQQLLLGEFDGLLVRGDIEQVIGRLLTALRDRVLTEEQLMERAYRLVLLREWLHLIRR